MFSGSLSVLEQAVVAQLGGGRGQLVVRERTMMSDGRIRERSAVALTDCAEGRKTNLEGKTRRLHRTRQLQHRNRRLSDPVATPMRPDVGEIVDIPSSPPGSFLSNVAQEGRGSLRSPVLAEPLPRTVAR